MYPALSSYNSVDFNNTLSISLRSSKRSQSNNVKLWKAATTVQQGFHAHYDQYETMVHNYALPTHAFMMGLTDAALDVCGSPYHQGSMNAFVNALEDYDLFNAALDFLGSFITLPIGETARRSIKFASPHTLFDLYPAQEGDELLSHLDGTHTLLLSSSISDFNTRALVQGWWEDCDPEFVVLTPPYAYSEDENPSLYAPFYWAVRLLKVA